MQHQAFAQTHNIFLTTLSKIVSGMLSLHQYLYSSRSLPLGDCTFHLTNSKLSFPELESLIVPLQRHRLHSNCRPLRELHHNTAIVQSMLEELLPLNFMHTLDPETSHKASTCPSTEGLDTAYCALHCIYLTFPHLRVYFLGYGILDVIMDTSGVWYVVLNRLLRRR
jgi:hypothetical protein